jgi:subtilisin-like proprotein convertase family protein
MDSTRQTAHSQRTSDPWLARSACALALATALLAGPASATVPATSQLEATLNSTGGGPAADGNYAVTFLLYKDATDVQALWSEGPVQIAVKNGQFSYLLGSTSPIPQAVLAAAPFLTFKLNTDPELARKPLASSLLAVRAAVAESLDCTGCIPATAINPQVLSAYAKKSDLAGVALSGNYSDLSGLPSLTAYAKTADLAKVATTGSFADLANKPVLAVVGKSCGSGLVVAGFKADGTLDCVAGGAAGALPADGIDEISNGLIFNQFTDVFGSLKQPIDIPDNNPIGASDTIVVPDVGVAQKLSVQLTLVNSDISAVKIYLYDPANTEYLLYDKGGKKGDGIITTYPDNTKPVSGDLTTWVGKNPKGNWILKVIDASFLNNAADGQIQKWSINVQTLSNKKIQIKGDLIIDGKLTTNGSSTQDVLKVQDFQTCTNPDPNGPCFVHFTGGRTFVEAAKYCASLKADVCTDSQVSAARNGLIVALMPNWTNSYADNDSGVWSLANGGTGDDHPATSLYLTPCCYNYSPPVQGEQTVAGIRVLKVNNSANTAWTDAVAACMAVQGDLCDKSQYYVLRSQGLVSTTMWASDHSDNDGGDSNSSVGSTGDDPSPTNKFGYACCATSRTSLVCPSGSSEIAGVCVAKVVNSNTSFTSAATTCAGLGAHICSIAQTAVLRSAGSLSTTGTWTGSHSDSDSGQNNPAIGGVSDDPTDGQGYGYACCF